jgi:hypothetical protein
MSRIASGNEVVLKATNNAFTAFAAAAVVVELVALVFLIIRAKAIFPSGSGLF